MSEFALEAYARTPQENGVAIADRMRGVSLACFIKRLDDDLEQMRGLLLNEGIDAPTALKICRAARQIAQEEWARNSVAI